MYVKIIVINYYYIFFFFFWRIVYIAIGQIIMYGVSYV